MTANPATYLSNPVNNLSFARRFFFYQQTFSRLEKRFNIVLYNHEDHWLAYRLRIKDWDDSNKSLKTQRHGSVEKTKQSEDDLRGGKKEVSGKVEKTRTNVDKQMKEQEKEQEKEEEEQEEEEVVVKEAV